MDKVAPVAIDAPRKFLQNFNTREQHMLLSGKAFSGESGNVEAVTIVYF
jgi:hypothetical protein